jgi:hypothetical protein
MPNILAVYRGRGTTKDLLEKQTKNTVIAITNRQIQPYVLQNERFFRQKAMYQNDFEPKILMKKICYYLEAALDETGEINPINTVYVIKSSNKNIDLKYLLGILSSKTLSYYARTKYMSTHMRGGYIELRVFEVEKLPIPLLDFNKPVEKKHYSNIVKLVDSMIEARKQQKNIKFISNIQKQIDDIVYSLYQFSPEEIDIIEGSK